jgi:hypothetical protein
MRADATNSEGGQAPRAATRQTIKGKPVTEADVQDWADEAERGYDVEQLRKRGRKPIGGRPAQAVPVGIAAGTAGRADRTRRT